MGVGALDVGIWDVGALDVVIWDVGAGGAAKIQDTSDSVDTEEGDVEESLTRLGITSWVLSSIDMCLSKLEGGLENDIGVC